jgi:hypothetical protein
MGLIKLMKENVVSQDLCLYTLTVLVWNFGRIVVCTYLCPLSGADEVSSSMLFVMIVMMF